jgi:hypothetical protein
VELVKADVGQLVRISLRNTVDEAVIGYHFEINGPDPSSGGGFFAVGCFQETPVRSVIGPNSEFVVEVMAENFEAGFELHLNGVLFESGRGEGEGEEIAEMRMLATDDCLHASRPATPLP